MAAIILLAMPMAIIAFLVRIKLGSPVLYSATRIGKDFIGDDTCAMILGDNFFYGGWFRKNLEDAVKIADDGYATIFGYYVKDPERFGIVEFDKGLEVVSVEKSRRTPNQITA